MNLPDDFQGAIYPAQSLEARSRGDKRGLVYSGMPSLQPFVCDLSSAQSLKEFAFAGDVFYVDKTSTGTVGFRLDSSWQRSFPLGANGAMRGVPYKSILLEWEAQTGKTAIVWYGYGVEIVPPNQDITSIGSITNPVEVTDYGIEFGSSFQSNAALASGGTEIVFAAASNTDGAIIHTRETASGVAGGTGNIIAALHLATVVPAAYSDGIIDISRVATWGDSSGFLANRAASFRAIRYAPGRGAWWRNSGANGESSSSRTVKYTL